MKSVPILLLLLLSCALVVNPVRGVADHEETERPALRTFVLNQFETEPAYHHGHGNARQAIYARFGGPVSYRCEIRYGRDPTEPDEFTTWTYDGLVVEMSGPLTLGGEWLSDVELTSTSIQMVYGLRIGLNKADFINVLGVPRYETADGVIGYYYDGTISDDGWNFGVHARVFLHVDAQDRVEKIRWEYFAD